MPTGGHHDNHLPPKFLQIKQDDKFVSRLSSKEGTKGGEASFRVLYYGGASGAIPFTWESQPGTPKHTFEDAVLPPLTPPPSYQMSPKMKTMQKYSKSKFSNSFFPSFSSKKSGKSPSFSSSSASSSSFSSSYSLPSTPRNPYTSRRKGIRRSRSAIHFGLDEEDDEQAVAISPASTLCFGAGNSTPSGKFRSYPPMKNVKKAFLSLVGHSRLKERALI